MQIYRKHHNGQLSIEEFHVPYGCTLAPDNRWVIFSSLMPWEELEETMPLSSAPHCGPCEASEARVWRAFIKQRLGLTDEEIDEQIRENANMQVFLALLAIPARRHSTRR
ncbi:hypothetical protein EBZ37_09930 [bacterium]|nr:hypothetical protein [bacterium]